MRSLKKKKKKTREESINLSHTKPVIVVAIKGIEFTFLVYEIRITFQL